MTKSTEHTLDRVGISCLAQHRSKLGLSIQAAGSSLTHIRHEQHDICALNP